MCAAIAPEQTQPELSEILEEVRRIDLQSRRLVTDVMTGGYVSVFRGAGLEFDGVRAYTPGDDRRRVDWNVTARMGRPFVKTFVDERELTVLFLVDLSASMNAGFGVWSARQVAARVCACLGLAATRNNDQVGMIACSEGVDSFVEPGKGLQHTLRIVRDVLALPAGGPGTALGAGLRLAATAVRRKAILFLVSDFLHDGWQHDLGRCARRHDAIAIRLLPPDLELPRAGMIRARDPETGHSLVLDTSSAAVRAAYAARIERWRARTEADLRRAGVDLMDVAMPRERGRFQIADPLLRFFRMRELRSRKR
jgi:uncharacterized protein (DUF58 family)